MSFYKVIAGAKPTGTQWNATVLESLKQGSLNLVRELIDREVSFSADGTDFYGEAYVDATGRLDSVDTNYLEPLFDSSNNNYGNYRVETPYDDDSRIDGTIDTSKWTVTVDGGSASISNYKYKLYEHSTGGTKYATIEGNGATLDTSKTYYIFGSYSLSSCSSSSGSSSVCARVYCYFGGEQVFYDYVCNYSNKSGTIKVKIFHDGSDWMYTTDMSSTSGTTISPSDDAFKFHTTGNGTSSDRQTTSTLYINDCGSGIGNSYIYHTIPSGTFSSTISSSYAKVMYDDYEDGVSVQYKFTNASEDSGWLSENEINTFTAFTSEPTTCIVKLIPKTSSPTAGYPSIKGVAFRGSN